jgi:hypothetical protein
VLRFWKAREGVVVLGPHLLMSSGVCSSTESFNLNQVMLLCSM